MKTRKKTGATAAGRAEPCPQVTQLHQFRPFLGMSEAQTSAAVRRSQGQAPEGGNRVLQNLFTVRNDATLGDALDTLGHLLYQANGVLGTLSENSRVDEDIRAAAWGVAQLLEQAQAALSLADAMRGLQVHTTPEAAA